MTDSRVYFAVEADVRRLVQRLEDRRRSYLATLRRTDRLQRAGRAWRAYYGWGTDGTSDTNALMRDGASGELVRVTPNTFAQLEQQTVVRILGQRPAVKPVANNRDYRSMACAQLADGILAHYEREASLDAVEDECVHLATLLTEAWLVMGWDAVGGRELGADPETGRPVHEGDADFRALTMADVWYDAQPGGTEKLAWFAFRSRANKHELAAQYAQGEEDGQLRERILRASGSQGAEGDVDWRADKDSGVDDEDNAWVYEFRHLRTAACPQGRLVRYLSSDCVLYDSGEAGYPYQELHAHCLRPESYAGGTQGHSSFLDLLGLFELQELIATVAATNVNGGALLNFWCPDGAAPSVQQLSSGLNIIQTPTKPEALEMGRVSPEAMQLFSAAGEWMRNRVGINEMAASGSAKSGMPAQLAALMEAQTQQLHAGLGAGYARLVVRSRTSLLRLLKRFAHSTRVAQIAGKSGDWQLREWSASDLEPMDRVSGEPVNPSMRNFAGRMQVADTLLQHGAINPRQYLTLYTTGRLDSTWEFEAANLARVQRDKELLREGVGLPPVDAAASMQAGEPVFADDGRPHVLPLLTDTHWVDIPEALGVLATPEARGNPEVAKAVTEVVRRRLELYRQMPLELRVMLGDPHLEALAPAAPPPAPPMKPEGAAGAVEQPAPPPDPITGEQAAPPLKS